MEASRWDRLEDMARRLDRQDAVVDQRLTRYETRLRSVEEDVEVIGRIDERLKQVERKVDGCATGIRDLEKSVRAERDAQVKEQKASRRWVIIAVITAAGVTITALGLIIAVVNGTA